MRLHDEAAAHANRKITALRQADRGLCARDAMVRLGFKVAGDVSWDAVHIAVAREFLDAYYRSQGMPGTGMPKPRLKVVSGQ